MNLNLNGYNIGSNNNKSFTDHLLLEEIMDLQNRCMSIENDNEKLALLDEFNTYAMSIQKKYENV